MAGDRFHDEFRRADLDGLFAGRTRSNLDNHHGNLAERASQDHQRERNSLYHLA